MFTPTQVMIPKVWNQPGSPSPMTGKKHVVGTWDRILLSNYQKNGILFLHKTDAIRDCST